MRINDNSYISKENFTNKFPQIYLKTSDKTLEHLQKNENILVFPNDFTDLLDIDKNQMVMETINNDIKFNNLIGFIGHEKEKLEIKSRFSIDNDDYFFNYMLQKVLNLNIVDLKLELSLEEQYYQLLIYLFPKYLNDAVKKGLFKEYKNFSYSDYNVKGSIIISRHIKENTPFLGNVSYATREFTYDNDLMQLIRHTIEYIKSSSKSGKIILNSSELIKENIANIIQYTSTYNFASRKKLLI